MLLDWRYAAATPLSLIHIFFGMRLEWLLRPDVGITQAPRPFSVGLAPLPLPERSFVPRYFGAKLRFLRMTHDETVRGLGAVIQRTSPYITRLEQGTRPVSYTHLDVYKRQN